MPEWQTIVAALVVLCALIYTGRRAFKRLKAFRSGRDGAGPASACETGCGSCGDSPKKPAATQRTVFVEISRTGTGARRRN